MNHSSTTLAENILGLPIEWMDDITGYLPCPGKSMHSGNDGTRDCRIKLDGAPTLYCVHQSCKNILAKLNLELRSAFGKVSYGKLPQTGGLRLSAEDLERKKATDRLRLQSEARRLAAAKSKESILKEYAVDPRQVRASSPDSIPDDAISHWHLMLRLFKSEDILWIGERKTTGDPQFANHFNPVSTWEGLENAPSQLICPNPFKPDVHSRSNENIANLRYLVVESDELTKPEMCAVFNWCMKSMHLRAVVDTGGKSLHGWFDYPSPAQLEEFKDILPALGCDPALFKPSQPCRLAGSLRRDGQDKFSINTNYQKLIYLDTKGVYQ